MPQADAIAFNAALRKLSAPSDCADMFRAAIAPFGFDTFACGELDLTDRDRSVFYIIDWPDDWRRFYIGSGLINRDPLIDALATRCEPYTWSELRAGGNLPQAARRALDFTAAAGWIEGLVVPLPYSGNRVGLVSLAGRRTDIAPDSFAYLSLISICLHSHVRTRVAHDGFAVPPAGLTEREIASIRLVARGVSDAGIGAALGVATSTAHEFVEKAKRRLKAKSRAELIAVAVSLAIIDI